MSTPQAIPDVQRAWVSVRKGTPRESLELRNDWPVKKRLEHGEVLVKVHSAALNPVGYKMMELVPGVIANRPYVPESDFSGTVVDSNDSKEFREGDEVFGWILFSSQLKSKQGALSEYIAVQESWIVKRPPNITEVEAAGVTFTAMTALQALNQAGLEQGQTLFVNGGSTAVGAWAIQLAKIRGCKVVATASGKNEDYVKKMGADEFIDYTKVGPLHSFLAANPPYVKYNVILEAVGQFDPSLYTHSAKYLAPNGVFITVGPQPHGFGLTTATQLLKLVWARFFPSFLTGVKSQWQLVFADPKKVEDLKQIQEYLKEGKLKPFVDSVYFFEDVLQAYDKIKSSRARGKVTINVSSPLVS